MGLGIWKRNTRHYVFAVAAEFQSEPAHHARTRRHRETLTRNLILVAIALLLAKPAAALVTGNQLYELCKGQGSESPFCFGYIAGVAEFSDALLFELEDAEPFSFCRPRGVTTGQIVDVVTKYLAENPDELHNPALVEVIVALRLAWPCPLSAAGIR